MGSFGLLTLPMHQTLHGSQDLQKQDVSNPHLGHEYELGIHINDEGQLGVRMVEIFPMVSPSVILCLLAEFLHCSRSLAPIVELFYDLIPLGFTALVSLIFSLEELNGRDHWQQIRVDIHHVI